MPWFCLIRQTGLYKVSTSIFWQTSQCFCARNLSSVIKVSGRFPGQLMRDDPLHADKGATDVVKQSPINNAFVSDCLASRTGGLLKNGGHVSSSSGQRSLCATHPVFGVQLSTRGNDKPVQQEQRQRSTAFEGRRYVLCTFPCTPCASVWPGIANC